MCAVCVVQRTVAEHFFHPISFVGLRGRHILISRSFRVSACATTATEDDKAQDYFVLSGSVVRLGP